MLHFPQAACPGCPPPTWRQAGRGGAGQGGGELWGMKTPPGNLDKSFLSQDLSLGEKGCNTVAVVSLFEAKKFNLTYTPFCAVSLSPIYRFQVEDQQGEEQEHTDALTKVTSTCHCLE